jgi:uncharacterized protein YutE (UPF0331/DUF86 family)
LTPRRFDPDVVHARLAHMRQLLADLEAKGDVTAQRLGHDRDLRYIVERILTQLVELAVAINGHIAAAVLGRGPVDYADSFDLVADADVLPAELAVELRPSAGLRNVLVHGYLDVDLAQVAGAVPRALAAYRRYVEAVARFAAADVRRDP